MSTPTTRTPQVFALDFDGVICDSLEEGLLVSWNTHTRASVNAFVEPGLAGVPPEIADRFTGCRPFARHLGHWLVPFVISSVPASRAEFAACYEELPDQMIETFTVAAARYRAQVRRVFPERWLAHHRVQPGLGELTDAYVVTARDHDSVRRILNAHAIGIDHTRIFGSRSDKPAALRTIAMREAVAPGNVTLVDDNIENCVSAQAAGYCAWWARWGYNTPGDQVLAIAHGIPAISIDALREPLRASRLR